jgi:hypothetical protein
MDEERVVDAGRSARAASKRQRLWASLLAAAVAVGLGGVWWRTRGNFDSVLASSDPCAARVIASEVAAEGTPHQRALLQSRLTECDARTAPSLCESLTSDVEARRVDEGRLARVLAASDRGPLTAEVYRALATRAPRIADLERSPQDLACPTLWPKLVDDLAAGEDVWSTAVQVSEPMKEALRARKLSPAAQAALVRHAQGISVIRAKGETAIAATAAILCGLVDYLQAGDAPACRLPTQVPKPTQEEAPRDPFADLPPLFAEASRERQAQRTGLVNCFIACAHDRTPAEEAADRQRADLANRRQRECPRECGSDRACLSNCLRQIPPSSTMACQSTCNERFPQGNLPAPKP